MQQYQIIDFHNHIFPGKIVHKAVDAIGAFYSIGMEGVGSPEDLLSDGKKAGISCFVVHSAATTPAQVQSINRFICEQAQLHPEFIPFATLHPFMENLEAEVEHILSQGVRGIKLHPDFQQFNLDDPKAMELYRAIDGEAMLLLHAGDETRDYSSPRRLAKILDAFPDLTVIAAHFGGYSAWEDSRKYLVGRKVYFDTSSSLFKLTPREAVDMMHDHGMEKMLYGTDYPMWTHEEELGRFNALPLTEEERRMVFHGNAARLLGL